MLQIWTGALSREGRLKTLFPSFITMCTRMCVHAHMCYNIYVMCTEAVEIVVENTVACASSQLSISGEMRRWKRIPGKFQQRSKNT